MDLFAAMRIFVRVTDKMSFSAAADELDISSSSVSKQIAQLEQRVGAKLLQRTTRRLSLTEVGEGYYQQCLAVLREVEESDNLVSQLQGAPRGTLKINCNMTFGQLLLSRAVNEFMAEHSELNVDITLDDRMPDLIRDGFDLAIRIAEPTLPNSTLVARQIAAIPLYIVASPSYMAKAGRPASAQQLLDHNCLVFVHASNADQWRVEQPSSDETVRVSGDLRANNSLVAREAVVAGRGIANLAYFAIEEQVRRGELQRVFPEAQPEVLSVYAIYPDRRYLSPKVSVFIEFLQHWLEQQLSKRWPAS
ncbi:LysR family transcriptional regulator [Porticoccaceae bacterium]|nr:LysR family transcriptional regulator [Porticoccaceae bacterium]